MTARLFKHQRGTNALPENTNFRDNGCEYSPSCLTCPLRICKFDDPGWIKREDTEKRDEAFLRFKSMKWSADEIATEMKVSSRTVHRVLRAQRELQEAAV